MASIQSFLTPGRTGQLIIKFKGEAHLCKLYIEDGEVVYLSCGRRSPEEVLDALGNMEIEAVNFIDGIRPPKRLDSPVTSQVLERVSGTEVSAGSSGVDTGKTVDASKVDTLIEDFIDIVGPLGTVIVDNTLAGLGYKRGQPIAEGAYQRLLQALTDEVPEDQKAQFRARHL